MDHDRLSARERGELWIRLGIRLVLTAAAVLLAVYVVLPAVSLMLPFVLGLIVAWIFHNPVRYLQRKTGISRKAVSLVVLLLTFCILGGGLFGLVWVAFNEARHLMTNWSSVTDALLAVLANVNGWLSGLERFFPIHTGTLYAALADWVRGLDVSGWVASIMGRAPSLVSGVSGFAVGLIIFLMASYFITGDYPRLRFLVTDRMPASTREFVGTVKRIFIEAFGGYMKSQLILTLGVFLILALGFLFMGQPYGLVLALVLAVMDFIPIIGSGTVLAPWAVIDLISGNYTHAIGFAVIWGVVVVFRRLAEPKILGDQTGLSPVLSLVGIYAGMKLGGVLGMILGPLLLLVCINLTKLGIFHPAAMDIGLAARDIRAILKGKPAR